MVMSVLHSSVITLLTLIVLSIGHKSYFFNVFTKLWLSIAIISLLNAFFFLPVILSLVGPTPRYEDKKKQRIKDIERSLSSYNSDQLDAIQL